MNGRQPRRDALGRCGRCRSGPRRLRRYVECRAVPVRRGGGRGRGGPAPPGGVGGGRPDRGGGGEQGGAGGGWCRRNGPAASLTPAVVVLPAPARRQPSLGWPPAPPPVRRPTLRTGIVHSQP